MYNMGKDNDVAFDTPTRFIVELPGYAAEVELQLLSVNAETGSEVGNKKSSSSLLAFCTVRQSLCMVLADTESHRSCRNRFRVVVETVAVTSCCGWQPENRSNALLLLLLLLLLLAVVVGFRRPRIVATTIGKAQTTRALWHRR
jgi:hypothetical protein